MDTIQHSHNAPMQWADQAACVDLDPALFYVDRGEQRDARVEAACNRCPVRSDCLDHALRHERFGFWAGQSEKQRKKLRKALGITLIDPTNTTDDPDQEAP